MFNRFRRLQTRTLSVGGERTVSAAQTLAGAVAALVFVLAATAIVAFDSLIPGRNNIAALQVGDIAPQDIRAPFDWRYESRVLTERRQQEAMANTAAVFDAPDPNVARQQVQLARQILDFVDNVRRDPFGTLEQKAGDINYITALTLARDHVDYILSLSDEAWRALDTETISVLERVMRQELRESTLPLVRTQLPTQVSVRFADSDVAAITDIVQDLLRPNTFANPDATEAAQRAAAAAVSPESRVFERGQIVVREGARIEAVDYEALAQLGLLQSSDRRLQEIARAFLASAIVMVGTGLYVSRFKPSLFGDIRFLTLLAALFLLILLGARLVGADNQIYIYPTAALALLLVALTGPEIALIGVMGMAFLVGLMLNRSMEIASFVTAGGVMGTLALRRAERLNSFFIAGLIIALANIAIVTTFNLEMLTLTEGTSLGVLVIYGLVNGMFSAAVALAGMYVVTLLFNLPTSLKLVELSQPNQPLLQRLLREAPGTYQHSLQVGNLGEQAANAIGANAELVRVAALYHDIGKMLNPAFFVENQADNVNPHDVLNDPYRSAAIIISHVTDGDRLARQYRLPSRIRDFILEHHGTTLVSYFYRQAAAQAEDEEAVDIDQFTYPGPRPRSRESAIMMLADSCESAVRARKPTARAEIADIVQQIIDARLRDSQLDESYLTSNDIKTIRSIFVEMLQAVFHPRINYPNIPMPAGRPAEFDAEAAAGEFLTRETPSAAARAEAISFDGEPEAARPQMQTSEIEALELDDDDSPLPEVPPLRRTGMTRKLADENGDERRSDERIEDKLDTE